MEMTLPSYRSLSRKAKRTYASQEFPRDARAFPPLADGAHYRSQGTRFSFLKAGKPRS
jgi:hypothetical protein